MDILWTPWRLDYILSKKQPGCVLCQKIQDELANDPANYMLYRGQYSCIILNLYPYNTGHLMVVPYAHLSDLTKVDTATLTEIGSLTQSAISLINAVLHPEGFNLGINLGKVAGAGIDDHLHQHIVPRWAGDTNYMPVVAQTRTIPDMLEGTYTKLRERLPEFFPAQNQFADPS
jgi:ATP adenylyltransferase